MAESKADLSKLTDEELLATCHALADEQEAERQKLVGLSRKEFYARDRTPFWDAHNRVVVAFKELHRRGLDGGSA